jgi:hypothetical protein
MSPKMESLKFWLGLDFLLAQGPLATGHEANNRLGICCAGMSVS